jgi:hypothetical protein
MSPGSRSTVLDFRIPQPMLHRHRIDAPTATFLLLGAIGAHDPDKVPHRGEGGKVTRGRRYVRGVCLTRYEQTSCHDIELGLRRCLRSPMHCCGRAMLAEQFIKVGTSSSIPWPAATIGRLLTVAARRRRVSKDAGRRCSAAVAQRAPTARRRKRPAARSRGSCQKRRIRSSRRASR